MSPWSCSCRVVDVVVLPLYRFAVSGCSVDTRGPQYSACSCSRPPPRLLCGDGGTGGCAASAIALVLWGGGPLCPPVGVCSAPGEGTRLLGGFVSVPELIMDSENGLGWKGPVETLWSHSPR